ncbi:hypothetical protein AAFM48_21650 [Burkholderia pseudomallei]
MQPMQSAAACDSHRFVNLPTVVRYESFGRAAPARAWRFRFKQLRRGARVIASIFALAGRGTADHRTGPPRRRDAHRDSARGSSSDRAAIAQLRVDVERPSRRRPPRRQPSRDSGRRFFTSPAHAAPSTLPDKFRHCARGALSIFDIKSKT